MRLLFLLLLTSPAFSAPRVDHLSLSGTRLPFQRDYFFPGQQYWGHELQLDWNVGWGSLFSENTITARTYNDRFRYVGWEFNTGFNLTKGFDLLWHHHSQHALDEYRDKFPVSDSYGFRLTFIGGK